MVGKLIPLIRVFIFKEICLTRNAFQAYYIYEIVLVVSGVAKRRPHRRSTSDALKLFAREILHSLSYQERLLLLPTNR